MPCLGYYLPCLPLLTLVMGRQLWTILFASKNRGSAPLLHRRFVLVFSLAALTPAILVGTFSTTLISRNINDVLGGSNRAYMEEARTFLDSYLADERRALIRDASTLKRRLNASPELLSSRVTNTARLAKRGRSHHACARQVSF